MRGRPFTRRELVLVLTTAIVAFAVAVPLTAASSEGAAREFTIWPNNAARFANMDWSCSYIPRAPAVDQQGNFEFWVPPSIVCERESTANGVKVTVGGRSVEITRCFGENGRGVPSRCNTVKRVARTP